MKFVFPTLLTTFIFSLATSGSGQAAPLLSRIQFGSMIHEYAPSERPRLENILLSEMQNACDGFLTEPTMIGDYRKSSIHASVCFLGVSSTPAVTTEIMYESIEPLSQARLTLVGRQSGYERRALGDYEKYNDIARSKALMDLSDRCKVSGGKPGGEGTSGVLKDTGKKWIQPFDIAYKACYFSSKK